jgi:hypothetical protein
LGERRERAQTRFIFTISAWSGKEKDTYSIDKVYIHCQCLAREREERESTEKVDIHSQCLVLGERRERAQTRSIFTVSAWFWEKEEREHRQG